MEWFNLFFQNLSININQPLVTISLFFFAGVLSSLFPCYYPLIPITAGYLQKISENQKPWLHPFFYWLGTLSIYTLLGFTASLGGALFSKWMQNGWIILVLGLLFLYLSYSMIDFVTLDFSFFRRWENQTRQKNVLISTFFMGMIAGLAASACVSPALVSILLFIAQITSSLEKNLFSMIFGIFLATIYGAGLGVPFFISGILGSKLPRTGKWMNLSKYFLALIVFLVAIYQIDKGLRVFEIDEKTSFLILFTLILVLVIIYLIGKTIVNSKKLNLFQFNKYFAYFSIVFSFFIILLFIQSLGSKSKVLISEDIKSQNFGIYEEKKNLKIYRNYFEAREIARIENKPIFLDFYADWCTNCIEFSKLIEKEARLNQALQKSILVKIHDNDLMFDEFSKKKNFEELQIGLPFFVILSPDEKILFKTNNYKDIQNMIQTIENYK